MRAQAAGLDLVEVAPQSVPPVCRIMDYGKWKYAQNKKEAKSKAKRHETELKEIRIKTPKIGDHDLDIKIKHARDFLGRGDRVQFSLRFRGRELAHIDEGMKVFDHIREGLADCSKIDQNSRREGRRITMTLAPGGAAAAKPAEKAAKPKAPRPPQPAQDQPPQDQPAAQQQQAQEPQQPAQEQQEPASS